MTSVLVINFTAEITDKRRDADITSDSWSVHYTFGSRRGSQFQIFRIRRRQTTRFQYPSKQWNRKLSPTRIHPTCCSRKYSYLWEGVKRPGFNGFVLLQKRSKLEIAIFNARFISTWILSWKGKFAPVRVIIIVVIFSNSSVIHTFVFSVRYIYIHMYRENLIKVWEKEM